MRSRVARPSWGMMENSPTIATTARGGPTRLDFPS